MFRFNSFFALALFTSTCLIPAISHGADKTSTPSNKGDRIIGVRHGGGSSHYVPPPPVYHHTQETIYVDRPVYIDNTDYSYDDDTYYADADVPLVRPAKIEEPYNTFYVGIKGGVASVNHRVDLSTYNGGIYSDYDFEDYAGFAELSAGAYVTSAVRLEAAYTYFGKTNEKQDKYYVQRNFGSGFEDVDYINKVKMDMLMLNLLLDFGRPSEFRTYLGFGAGIAHVEEERIVKSRVSSSRDHEGTVKDDVLAVQFQVGFIAPVTENIALDFNVRGYYADTENGTRGFAGGLGVMFSF